MPAGLSLSTSMQCMGSLPLVHLSIDIDMTSRLDPDRPPGTAALDSLSGSCMAAITRSNLAGQRTRPGAVAACSPCLSRLGDGAPHHQDCRFAAQDMRLATGIPGSAELLQSTAAPIRVTAAMAPLRSDFGLRNPQLLS